LNTLQHSIVDFQHKYPLAYVLGSSAQHAIVAGFIRPGFTPKITSETFIWSGTYTVQEGQTRVVIRALQTFASKIKDTEPETLAYVVLVDSTEASGNVLQLWEMYSEEKALSEVHAKSDLAEKLKEQIGMLLTDRDMRGYKLVDLLEY